MRRIGNIFNKMISDETLSEALRKACLSNGRSSPSKRIAIARAKAKPDDAIRSVKEAILTNRGTSKYHIYPLFDPKLRFIYALPFFPDRVIHHALMVVIEDYWDKRMHNHSFACRRGKGQHGAGKLCMQYTKKYKYCAQFDISQFYVSINHEILKRIIRKKIKDTKVLMILDEIVDSISTRDKNLEMLYAMKARGFKHRDIDKEIQKLETSKAKDNGARAGLPIGSYTSQWFGNLYMNELDQYLTHGLGCKAIVRYCDDFLVFSNDKDFLQSIKKSVSAFLWNKLHLLLSKSEVFPTTHGVDFCGYRYFPNGYVLLRKRTAKKHRKDIKAIRDGYRSGKISKENARMRIDSIAGWLRWANAHNFKESVGFYELQRELKGA